MSGAASSSTMPRLQVGPQNSVNQRPTMTLFSCSFDIVISSCSFVGRDCDLLLCISKGTEISCAQHSVSCFRISTFSGKLSHSSPNGYAEFKTNCGSLGWVTDRKGYRYDSVDPETQSPWPPMPKPF